MICLRCGYELGTNQSACLRCGFFPVKSSAGYLRASTPQMRREGPLQQMQQPGQTRAPSSSSIELVPSMPPVFAADLVSAETPVSAGSLLCRGRYMLTKKQTFQQWAHGAYEAHWRARDMLREETKVLIIKAMHTSRGYLKASIIARQVISPDVLDPEHCVEQTISSIRRKLGEETFHPRILKGRRGLGYRLFPEEPRNTL